jgi:UV excision repair protein RAD23
MGEADQFPVPALVLSPAGSPTDKTSKREPIPLDIADPQSDIQPTGMGRPGSPVSSVGLRAVISRPQFWRRLREFLEGEVALSDGTRRSDADDLFEIFLLASKGRLEPTEVAKIRDAVQITGMSGT